MKEMINEKRMILGASIGNCVHVAGIVHFLSIAENEGYTIRFLGPAVSLDLLFEEIKKLRPEMVAVSYRLTPENVLPILENIKKRNQRLDYEPVWLFGGTKPVADIAKDTGIFSYISDGYDEISDSIRFLRGESVRENEISKANLVERIKAAYPYPLLRHHFGLPSLEQTIKGVEKIADSKILDIISIGPDQNAQQFFFRPDLMDKAFDGAGGVPVRKADDFLKLKEASLRGNFPLMRCYSGTDNVFEYAEMLLDTIGNSWAAIPLCWYNELDGRGTRSLEESIEEAQRLIRWHAKRQIPVEINEPHHWSLRDSHDVIPVAMAYISAYNAKKAGVRNYISQYMFNIPGGISFSMDMARILAMIEMVESLEDDGFRTFRQSRAGLPLFHADENIAKGQLAASTFMQMLIKPHIIHVVGFCEANHAANPENVIESCKIVKGVIRHTLEDRLSITKDENIIARKNELISEAKVLIDFIKNEYSHFEDPLTSSAALADCIKKGYIDAVHILKNNKFRGNLFTRFIDGKCAACDKKSGGILTEEERLCLIKGTKE